MSGVQPVINEVVLGYKPRKWARAHLHGPESAPNFKRSGAYVLHRRGGKTVGEVNKHVRFGTDNDLEARRLKYLQPDFTDRDVRELLHGRNYAHIFPVLKQAKAVAWQLLKDSCRGIVGFGKNESDLAVTLPGYVDPTRSVGPTSPDAPAILPPAPHTIRLWGGDNADALRGVKLSGAAFDEYQDHDPYLDNAVVSKSLADHLGYSDYLGTVKGRNQLYQQHKAFAKDPVNYTALWQDIDKSLATEKGATLKALRVALADDLKKVEMGLMTEALYLQEWFLSIEAAIEGAIWGKEMSQVRQQGRILRGIFDPLLPVDTDWDLGIADHMAIVASQETKSGEVRFIYAYANRGEGMAHYFTALNEWRVRMGAAWGKHYAPGDIEVRELTTGLSRRETAKNMGFEFETIPTVNLEDSINAVRLMLPRCYFDDEPTELFREALSQYRWKKNDTTNEYTSVPLHDWASHWASAMRTRALRYRGMRLEATEQPGEDFGSHTAHVIGEDDTAWMG